MECEILDLIGDVDRRELFREDQHASVKGWCRSLTRWSNGGARARARTAKLAAAFPAVAEALEDGLLGVAQSHEIARAFSNPRVRDQLGDVLEIFLAHAGLMSFEEFQQLVRRWKSIADADGATGRRGQPPATVGRGCTSMRPRSSSRPGGAVDGAEMCVIFQRYQDAEYLADWQHARAEHGPDATYSQLPRDAGQRAWDALHQIFEDAASTPPDAQPPEPVLNIVADLQTFQEALRDFGIELSDDDTDNEYGTMVGIAVERIRGGGGVRPPAESRSRARCWSRLRCRGWCAG